jgi:hypothetical protein
MDGNQEWRGDGQEVMKAQVASLASRIDVNREEMFCSRSTAQPPI